MGLFSKKEETTSCCCGGSCTPETMARAEAGKTSAGIKYSAPAAPNAMLWSMRSVRRWQNWAWPLRSTM